MTTGNMHKKLVKIGRVAPKMTADRQRHTQTGKITLRDISEPEANQTRHRRDGAKRYAGGRSQFWKSRRSNPAISTTARKANNFLFIFISRLITALFRLN